MAPINTLDTGVDRFITHGKIPSFQVSQFSYLAWKRIELLYNKIKTHPFNQELAFGTLPAQRFTHYLSQDAFYLDVYNKVLNSLSSKLCNIQDQQTVRQFAGECLDEKSPLARPEPPTQATLRYTQFLRHIGDCGSAAEIAAAVLPCFWIYYALGCDMQQFASKENNPYYFWIEQYSTPKFSLQVEFMKDLNNRLEKQQPPFMMTRMLHLFTTASQMEYDFWDSAYHSHK